MRRSEEVRDARVHFCERLSEGDVASFDELFSQEPDTLIDSAPGEWLIDWDRLSWNSW